MNRIKTLIAGLVLALFGFALMFADRIEQNFAPVPDKSALETITFKGPFETDIQVSLGRQKTRYFFLKLPDRDSIRIEGPNLDEVADAVSSSRRLTYHLSPKENKQFRQLWQLTSVDDQGNVETILAYEDCLQRDARLMAFFKLAGTLLCGYGISGILCGILGVEDNSKKSWRITLLTMVAAGAYIAIRRVDDINTLLGRDDKSTPSATGAAPQSTSPNHATSPQKLPFARTLVDDQGRSLNAMIIAVERDSVKIRRASDETEFSISFSKLSQEDREFFEAFKVP